MGIKFLNNFLKTECKKSIKEIGVRELSGKKIVVDIDIYMFKFVGENALIENMYLMFSIFRHYQIIPVFIFDGKTPTEKKELIEERREHKKQAQQEFNILKNKMDSENYDEDECNNIQNKMDELRKQFVYLTKKDFEIVKQLINAFGFTYIDAPGEADEICAYLNIKGKVWGCLSEDMDMFVYGCPRVIRYFSLLNHKCVVYDLKSILNELKINLNELKQICILSGTDYNKQNKEMNLYVVLKYFKKYKKKKIKDNFYEWMKDTTNLINDYDLLLKIQSMFDITTICDKISDYLDIYSIKNGLYDKPSIKLLLKDDGFIFP